MLLSIIKNKKAISVMVGYILLVTLGMVMAVMVYGYLKTYVPSDPLDCPPGTSLMLKEQNCANYQLNLTIKNNGKFNIEGMMIMASTSPGQEIATHDLTQYLNNQTGDGVNAVNNLGNYILYSHEENENMKPNDEKFYVFNLNDTFTYYNVEIIPIRFQDEKSTKRYVLCSEGKLKEELNCQ
jgi:hypothetical protein